MSVIEMSTLNINTVTQHEVWFAWRGYLVLRPRRLPRAAATTHPAWVYLGHRADILPGPVSRAITAPQAHTPLVRCAPGLW